MKRKINCETARNFSVIKTLEKLGHFPKRTAEKEAWFMSPFRSETQASFKVSKIKNRWYDHGEGKGGDVITLVCRILNCSIAESLEFLNKGLPINSIENDTIFENTDTEVNIMSVKKIEHAALIQYLIFRGIPLRMANEYCHEVWYKFKNKKFFAIGLRNNQNGWELRNKIFKNSSSPKSYTLLKRNNEQLIILEGMFDLLSLAVLNEALLKDSDVLVLNSISFVKNIELFISNYKMVHLYLDRDSAGQNATLYLTKKYSHVMDESGSYKNHKDLNDFLCHERK